MTRWTYLLLATVFLLLGQRSNGQTKTDTTKIQAGKITPRTVCGKYTYQTSHGYTILKIRHTKHFSERGLLYFGWTITAGKWKIQNDTLVLLEKSYRDKPFAKRQKNDTDTSNFIMCNNTLYRINNDKGNKTVGGTYITKRQSRKNYTERKRKIKEQYNRMKKNEEIK